MRLGRILKDYSEAGSLNELIGLWGFVDDAGTFLTKAGFVGVVYGVTGVDYEHLTHAERHTLVHQVEAGLRLLDEHCRLYQYLFKRITAPFGTAPCPQPHAQAAVDRRAAELNGRRHELYELSHYLVLMYEAPTHLRTSTGLRGLVRSRRDALASWLSGSRTLTLIHAELNTTIEALHFRAQGLELHLREVGLTRLGNAQAFRFFRALVNYDEPHGGAGSHCRDTHLDYFISDSAVECHRDHLLVGPHAVKVLSMKEPPSHTFAHVLGDLHAVSGEFIACLEWQRIPNDRARRDLQVRRRHFFNKRVAFVNYLSPETRPEDMLVDDSAAATVQQLGDALTELEVNGHFFGGCSLTLVLFGRAQNVLDQQIAESMRSLAVHDGQFFQETYNLLNAWLSIVPGNARYNLRRLALLDTNAADLSFVFTLDRGDTSGRSRDDALAVFETTHGTPFAFNLHVDDVGHTLILGATGSGKSFLINFLLTHAQKYDPVTVVLDLGHGYRQLTTLLSGSYLELDLQCLAERINPFAFEPSTTHRHFLHAFVRVLVEGTDQYRLNDLEDREVFEAVSNVYTLDPRERRLRTVANLLPRALAARLQKWIEGGRYAPLFDNEHDTLNVACFQVFDFSRMREYAPLLEPLLFYLLHRVTARVQAPADFDRLKLCVLDEAWRFIQHPMLRSYVHEALKTWRKHNAAMMLSTQAIEDFASPELLQTVIESCPTKLFVANSALDRGRYAELFQLNEAELELLAGLVPRQQVLLKRPRLAKVLNLRVDSESSWIYANTLPDGEHRPGVAPSGRFRAALTDVTANS